MRITQNMTYDTYLNDIYRRQDSVYNLSRQLSSGKSVNAPSDDPVKAGTILTTRGAVSELDQYGKNIDSGLSYLNSSEQALGGAKVALTRLQELAVSNSTGTADAAGRSAAAVEVKQLFDELVSLGNTSFDGKYIFSGYKSTTAAFTPAGAYQGDANKYQIKINPTTTMSIGVNGGEVFKGTAGGVDVLQAVSDFATALTNNDSAGINAAIGNLGGAFNQVSNAVTDIGAKVSRLTIAKDTVNNTKLDMQVTLSGLEDADITKLISDLQQNQAALQTAMSSAKKVFSVNIFDYL